MRALKPPRALKDLPGFDDALDNVRSWNPAIPEAMLAAAAETVVPGLGRCSRSILETLAHAFYAQSAERRRRLTLVPPPRIAANDCEATNG